MTGSNADRPAPPRSIDLEIEVAGTPEQVWAAIATGPGISAWMHPTEVDEREGGSFAFDMGFGLNESGVVTEWDPPRRFATEGVEWKPSDEAPGAQLATEWLVEGRSGGTCIVRMVMSGFGPGADWDAEIESMGAGMQLAMGHLRLYLRDFAGQRGAWIRAFGNVPGGRDEAWAALLDAVGLSEPTEGEESAVARGDGPAFSGLVVSVFEGNRGREVLLRIDDPAPGFASVSLLGDNGFAEVQACVYGQNAATPAVRQGPTWRTWMTERFPDGRLRVVATAP